jgi:uncharacterized integral membrane protein
MKIIMNRRQMIVLWVGIIIFVLMGLFPPLYRGYGFLLTNNSEMIQFEKLLIQWFILSAGITGLIYYLRGEQKMNNYQYIVIISAVILLVYLLIFAMMEPTSRTYYRNYNVATRGY